jgi:predicted ATP-binding protein involved in virulence
MLARIEVDNFQITLRNEKINNFYDVDALSMLIGVNGSGKTRMLSRIIKKVTSSTAGNLAEKLCRFFNEDGLELTSTEMKSYGILYFTALPFRPIFDNIPPNFIDASASMNGYKTVLNIHGHEELLKEFGIRPLMSISSQVNFREVVSVLLDELIKKDFASNSVSVSEIQGLQKLYEGKRENLSNSDFTASQKKSLSEDLKAMQGIIDRQKASCVESLVKEIVEKNSLSDIFSAFVVTERMISENQSPILFLDVLSKFIRFKHEIPYLINEKNDYDNDVMKIRHFLKRISKENIIEISFNTEKISHMSMKMISKVKSNLFFTPNESIKRYFDFGIDNVSSGEMALLCQISLLSGAVNELSNSYKKIIVLIDEGDAFLHLQWQRSYIYNLNRILAKLKNELALEELIVIVASHSPILATDFPADFICRLDNREHQKKAGFAAPLYLLLDQSFDSATIGEFAARKINSIIERIKKGQETAEDLRDIELIDNKVIFNEIMRLLNARGDN